MQSLTQYLEGRLKLKINPVKSKVAKISECGFLGFTIVRGKIRWLEKKLAAFKYRVKELTGRSWGVSMEFRLRKLGQYVRGWMGYFGVTGNYAASSAPTSATRTKASAAGSERTVLSRPVA